MWPSLLRGASLTGWPAMRESAQRWWASVALGASRERSVEDQSLWGRLEQSIGVAVTVATGGASGERGSDAAPPAMAAAVANEEAWDEMREPAAGTDGGATRRETDVPPVMAVRAMPPTGTELTGHEAVGIEAAMGDAAAWQRGAAALDAAWSPPAWSPMEALPTRDIEPARWAGETVRPQELLDEHLVVPAEASAGAGEQVVVVNMTGVDETEIADIALEQYEAAQLRRRFRAHVPG